jgi:hypothetical protein
MIGSRLTGGTVMVAAFPLLVIPGVLYALFAFVQVLSQNAAGAHEALVGEILSVPMPSGEHWSIGLGDLFILLGLFMLFFELIRATHSNKTAIVNHSLSMIVFVVALVLFLLGPAFATSTFFLLVMMTLLDVLAGFIVTIVASRRELDVAPSH